MPAHLRFSVLLLLGLATAAEAHDPSSSTATNQPRWFLAQNTAPPSGLAAPVRTAASEPAQAAVFKKFAPAVRVRWEGGNLYVESSGLPAHPMMTGITAWQQQVPLPQPYTGSNAWQIPLQPVPAKKPRSIHNQFLRGAIALAANGIPIFNPQNNRGEISAEIGELDRWGGHCGRADDYHYHAAPLHLEPVLGRGNPIAYALDGYPILGTSEQDGTLPAGLDTFRGHSHGTRGYHYHASTSYPFVNGGFHGEVIERDGQVDPQPRANPVRPALQALRGAKITGHDRISANAWRLTYEIRGENHSVTYAALPDGSHPFEFHAPNSSPVREVYTAQNAGDRPPGNQDRPPKPREPADGSRGKPPRDSEQGRPPRREDQSGEPPANDLNRPKNGFNLRSPAVPSDGMLPAEFTGEGAGISPPLEWEGAPTGTHSYALTMHHVDPEGRVKCYWILHHIPGSTRQIPANATSVGRLGMNSVNRRDAYAPPHSKGPGEKSYILTLYALSAELELPADPPSNLDSLYAALRNRVLASAALTVHFTRSQTGETPGHRPSPRP
jgi:phosphatidylethanolamine-binding protein (PEBP) family uncharacterized protein